MLKAGSATLPNKVFIIVFVNDYNVTPLWLGYTFEERLMHIIYIVVNLDWNESITNVLPWQLLYILAVLEQST